VRALDAGKASLKGSEKTLILSRGSPIAELFYDNGHISGNEQLTINNEQLEDTATPPTVNLE
jgi:hypothetical protein